MPASGEDLPTYAERIQTVIGNVSARHGTIEADTSKRCCPSGLQDNADPQDAAARNKRRRGTGEPAAPPTDPGGAASGRSPRRCWPVCTAISARSMTCLVMASFVPFLVYFMLSWRDHIRRASSHLFESQDGRDNGGRAWSSVGDVARAYVVGQLPAGPAADDYQRPVLLGAAPAVLAGDRLRSAASSAWCRMSVCHWRWRRRCWPRMIIYDGLTPYMMILAVVGLLHLLALNVLYPKLVGARVHLNPLVVTVALMFWGTLVGRHRAGPGNPDYRRHQGGL